MTFIPPTPSVKIDIASGASAADLGWSQSFYEKFCWQYGLRPINPAPKVHEKKITERLIINPLMQAISQRWKNNEYREIEIGFLAGRRVRQVITLHVERYEAAILIGISQSPEKRVSGKILAQMTNVSLGNTAGNKLSSVAARALRNKFIGTSLCLEVTKGPAGGYRIIHTKTKNPAEITVLRLGEIVAG